MSKKSTYKNHRLIITNIIMLVIFFAGLIKQILYPENYHIDTWIAQSIPDIRTPFFNGIMLALTRFGDPYAMAIFGTIILLLLLIQKRRINATILAIAMISGAAIVELIIKPFVDRFRPPNGLIEVISRSFPSGHATNSAIVFGFLMYCFGPEIKNKHFRNLFYATCTVLFLLIGFSRIYLGVHWTSDVIGGFALGLFILSGSVILTDKLLEKK